MTPDEKLDEALKETFPASDAFWLEPEGARPQAQASLTPARGSAALSAPSLQPPD